MTNQQQIQTAKNIPAQASSKARFDSQKQTGYVCKSCGGVAPVGIGFAVYGWQGVADESRTACDCGYSVKPVAESLPLNVTRCEYRKARRLIRDNGRASIAWMAPHVAAVMDVLTWGQQKDRLAERADIVAYCSREGIACTVRHTR